MLEGAEGGHVDVAADHAVRVFAPGPVDDCVLEVGDVLHGALGGGFGRGGERPVGLVQPATDAIEGAVEGQETAVGPAPNFGEPAGVADDAVELVAVQHEEPSPVGGRVDRLLLDGDAPELQAGKLAGGLVVVARNVDHVGVLCPLEQGLQHLIVRGGPVPGALQGPAVDDVAHEVVAVGFVAVQEVKKAVHLGGAGAEVEVGDPDCSVSIRHGAAGSSAEDHEQSSATYGRRVTLE
jgi:hypothetical protein